MPYLIRQTLTAALLLSLFGCATSIHQVDIPKPNQLPTEAENHQAQATFSHPVGDQVGTEGANQPVELERPTPPPLLEGLSDDDLTMLHQRAEANFPAQHWRVVAENSRFVRAQLLEVLRQEEVPMSLQVMPAIESKYDPYEVSYAGASGLWQFMPTTAKSMGLQCSASLNDIRHVEKSTRAAAQYLKQLYRQFNYWPLAIAAYNCGPTRLRSFLKRLGPWQPEDGLDALPAPKASKAYVKNVLSLAYAQHHGILEFPEPIATRQIKLAGAFDLTLLGKQLAIKQETLLRLNPELELTRYRHSPIKTLCLPASSQGEIAETSGYRSAIKRARRIKVKQGDSLWKIARNHNISLAALRRQNPSLSRYLQPGQTLFLPTSAHSLRNPLCRQ